MDEHSVVRLTSDFNYHVKGTNKEGPYEEHGTIPKGTRGTTVSEVKGDGCWVEFSVPEDSTDQFLKGDPVRWVETEFLSW